MALAKSEKITAKKSALTSLEKELNAITEELPRANEQYTKALEDLMPKILGQTATISSKVGIEPLQWMHYLSARTAFRSDSELAEELGVNRSSVARWKQGQPPQAKNREMLTYLNIVVSLLRGYLEQDVIPDWLQGVNPMLGERRPIDVLHTGRLSEVIAAIEAERSGAYA